jgi:glycosyltransferase involved in cell wall biosynthesis
MTMHLLATSRTLPFHSIGGMQSIAWDLLRAWAAAGHRVSVITTRIESRPPRFEHEGVQVVQVEGSAAERYGAAWWRGSDAHALALHRERPVDGVLSVSVAGAGLRGLRSVAPGVRHLMQAHGTSWGEAQSKWRTGRPVQWLKSAKNLAWLFKDAAIYRRFDEIVLVGDVLERQFATWPMTWIAHGRPHRLIRNGVDTGVFRPDPAARAAERIRLDIPQDAPLVVFAARLHPQKGASRLLDAFGLLAATDPAAHLLIVGGGEEEAALRARAAGQAWGARVRFTGAVARERIPALLAAGDAFAFPTLRQEGLPMNVLEAMAAGLRVVAADIARGVFAADAPIDYVDVGDVAGFARALAAALARREVAVLPAVYRLDECAEAYLRRFRPTAA